MQDKVKVRYGKHGKVVIKELKLNSPYVASETVWKAMMLNPYKPKRGDGQRSKSQSPPAVHKSVDAEFIAHQSQAKLITAQPFLNMPLGKRQPLQLPKISKPLTKSPPRKLAPSKPKFENSSLERSVKLDKTTRVIDDSRQSYVVGFG